jgi:hypothetical protein
VKDGRLRKTKPKKSKGKSTKNPPKNHKTKPSIDRVSFFQESESKPQKSVKIVKQWCNLEDKSPENNNHAESIIREEKK